MKSKNMQTLGAIMKMRESKTSGILGSNEDTDSTSGGFLSLLNILDTEPLPTQNELNFVSEQFYKVIKPQVSFSQYHDYCEQLAGVTNTELNFWEHD